MLWKWNCLFLFALMQMLSSDILVFFVLRSCVLRQLGNRTRDIVGSWSWGANLLVFTSFWRTHFGTNYSSFVRGRLLHFLVVVMAWSGGYHLCCFFVASLYGHTRVRGVLLLGVLNVVGSCARHMGNRLDFQTLTWIFGEFFWHRKLGAPNCSW